MFSFVLFFCLLLYLLAVSEKSRSLSRSVSITNVTFHAFWTWLIFDQIWERYKHMPDSNNNKGAQCKLGG